MTSRLLTLTKFGLLFLFISACGWQLRGQVNLPAQLQVLKIDNQQNNSSLVQAIEQSLLSNGVSFSEEAPYTLVILREENNRRVLSVTANAKASEYELEQTLVAELFRNSIEGERTQLGDDQPVSGEVYDLTITSYRTQLYDAAAELGKAQEADNLRRDMRRDNINKLMRRLQNLDLKTP
ncbi:LPS assembly lipoprotein LptE [Bermanella sp. R86510]|uniref:LPS-assembly lipoprotein LptE n=1 Tax=unclassified Bermanella TaxID=2627862 RepID=UPI0037C8B559